VQDRECRMTTPAIPAQQRPRLLLFYSPTAGASVRVSGFLAQVLQRRRNHDTFLVHRIDVSERPDLAERFRIGKTPAICIVEGKKVAARAEAPRGAAELEQLLKPWLR
jgi:thioredoxin-like negative regulator of GroEL